VIDNDIINGGEYQINDGIKRLMSKGNIFKTGTVDEWMDCGNKEVAIDTNTRIMKFMVQDGSDEIKTKATLENSNIIEPCVIADDVVIKNSTVGPHVSIGFGSVIENSTISNSLIQTNSTIKNAQLDQAMIGNHVKYNGNFNYISIGDYSVME
jgi:glucose-1-phosphate thymidylyltransferase